MADENIIKHQRWLHIINELKTQHADFDQYREAYEKCFAQTEIPFIWMPKEANLAHSNIGKLMNEVGCQTLPQLHQWSVTNRSAFWKHALEKLDIKFTNPPSQIINEELGAENPRWLPEARLNIVDSCLQGPEDFLAVIAGSESSKTATTTYGELKTYVNRIASGLENQGFKEGDRIVLFMPLNLESVACYLAIIKAGMIVVSVADSFSAKELKSRSKMINAKGIITCDEYTYNGKKLAVYDKVKQLQKLNLKTIVVKSNEDTVVEPGHILFEDILYNDVYASVSSSPDTIINILFSSGTTKEPKAIPWTHITPIKCAMDGYLHQDITSNDIVTWTTGMGWMMAPWLIFASLINKATLCVYEGSAATPEYAKFVETHEITIFGTIPSLVKVWRRQKTMEKLGLSIRVFSSTGEPSNAEDYFYLMYLAGFKAPIIEYCGGTEIGGGYISGTVVQPASPATFTTPAMGLDFILHGEQQDQGEVYIIPPSIGLSQTLLNRDHHIEYYSHDVIDPEADILRKHGDAYAKFPKVDGVNDFYKCLGRIDDSMNLGGIKVSSVELEELLNNHTSVKEVAAVSVQRESSGPDELVIFFVPAEKEPTENLKKELQQMISEELNPLFRISEVRLIEELPRTTSNKIMRRSLRDRLIEAK